MKTRNFFTERINEPKFRIGKFVFNRLEILSIQYRVATGELEPNTFTIVDEWGGRAQVTKMGGLTNSLFGLSVETELKFRLIEANKKA